MSFFLISFFNILVSLHPSGGFPCVVFLHPYKFLMRLNYPPLSDKKFEAPAG